MGHVTDKVHGWVKKNWLLVATLVGVVLGIILGTLLQQLKVSARTSDLVLFPGILLLRSLYMVVGPLILCSVINGISSVGKLNLGKAGGQVIAYYLITTIMAAVLGVVLGAIVQPGAGIHRNIGNMTNKETQQYTDSSDVALDILRNLVTDNIIRAMMQLEITKYKFEEDADDTNEDTKNQTAETDISPQRFIVYEDNVNFMGIIVFGIVFGVALRQIGREGNTLRTCVNGLNEVLSRIVLFVMYYSPVGAFFLIAGSIASVENLEEMSGKLAWLTVATVIGFSIHTCVLIAIYVIFTRKNPFRFIAGLKETLTIAGATASSMAALPTTIRCLEENLGISHVITRLMLPVGATVNMDAGALHASILCMYTAQLYDVHLGIGGIFKVLLYSCFASIGSAAIPNTLFVALMILLRAVGLPTRDIGLYFATEWFLDRLKTQIHVFGDCVGAALVDQWHRGELEENRDERDIKLGDEIEEKQEDNKEEDASNV